MKQLFLSQREDDSGQVTTAISDQLTRYFGHVSVVRDSPGAFDPEPLERSAVSLVLIGPRWLSARDDHGRRRIDDHQDAVRTGLRTAFERGIPVIPVLLVRQQPFGL